MSRRNRTVNGAWKAVDQILAEEKHYCKQCGKEMGFEWFLGPVCGKCCRENHKKVTGKK